MKRFYQRNKYIIAFILVLIAAFLAGCAVGTLKTKAETPMIIETVSDEDTETTYEPEKISLSKFKLTGYCICPDCCGGYSDGYTATMTQATPGRTIAVDPDVIPYGTIVEIDGYEYVAEDCGADIKGNRIDVLCASHELAEAFGVQYAEVYVVTEAEI